MIQHIFRQLWMQRKYNAWIFVELMLVFVLVWVLVDYVFVLSHNRHIPQGFDTDNTYLVTYGIYSPETNRHNPAEDDSAKVLENLDLFLRKIKEYKDVEIADIVSTAWGSIPFSGSYNGTAVSVPSRSDSIKISAQVKNVYSGNFFRIFRYTSAIDNSWERPARIDFQQNNPMLITRMIERELFGTESAIGKTIQVDVGEGKKEYIVADVLNDQKRFDYTLPQNAVFGPSMQLSADNIWSFGIGIRTREGVSEQRFISDFRKEMTGQLRIGNFYLKNIQSFNSQKEEMNYIFGVTNEVRTRKALMIFFLFSIALGIIATFWFRNETRKSEIGLRMAMGSTRTTLQLQFIAEALLLFSMAAVCGVIINYCIARVGLQNLRMDVMMPYETVKGSPYITQHAVLRFLITGGLTYILLAAVVALSAWIPARRAAQLHPVEALRDE